MNMVDRIVNYLKAGFPGLAIETVEEQRACADVLAAAKAAGKSVLTWSATEGLKSIADARKIDDSEFLDAAAKHRAEETVYLFRDAQTWPIERDPVLARQLRDLLAWAPAAGSCVVFVGSKFKSHPSFEKLVTVMDFALPSAEDLVHIAAEILKSDDRDGEKIGDDVIRALGGLSTAEAENALALSLIESGNFDPAVIYREKIAAVKRTGLLEIVEADKRGLNAIGGLDQLKDWILKRRRAYTPEAEHFGLPLPKGVLLVGVPGTGKSLSARAFGTALEVPTVKLDIGSLFGSLVGESEQKTRDALALAEAMSPCVLWVDEIDKGLAGASGSGSNDSGVTRRVFGSIITWMQERRRPVFLVATANQVEGLPPEFLRKGRFDEVFAIDLPTDQERARIIEIQLKALDRWRVNSSGVPLVDVFRVAAATDTFTGSEIEALIHEAMFEVFAAEGEKAEVRTDDLLRAAKSIVPLAVTAKEQINAIRDWAKSRARFASSPAAAPAASTAGKRRISKE